MSGRQAKWAGELGAYGISYALRSAIKGQVLADFLVDTMTEGNPVREKVPDSEEVPESSKARDALIVVVLMEVLNEGSVDIAKVNMVLEEEERTWMTPIKDYIKKGTLLDDPAKARTLKEKNICHGTKVAKGRHDFGYIGMALHEVGMYVFGPLLVSLRKINYLIVAIDYFYKWLEAKPVATITRKRVKNFPFDNIVCKFGVPATIITDNRTQLINKPFRSWAKGLEIKVISTSVYHPQADGAVKQANRSIMQGIKTRLHQEGAGWVEELSNMLWAH
ncbi:reverse transcriptase domain-containing protein [Tanacetum coccineum]